jgi:hypothetical protein
MRVAIMQPTYLPWLGFFDMMARVDLFILLDNVQFEKKSWQQRNRIRASDGELMLTVPVKTAGRFDQLIHDVEIDRQRGFARKHIRSLEANYRKAGHASTELKSLAALIDSDEIRLGRFNGELIRHMAARLGVHIPIIDASTLSATGRRTDLTVNQCVEVGASEFLAAGGSHEYVSQEPGFADAGISVTYHAYTPVPYRQAFPGFVPYLSAVDALLNLGTDAGALIGTAGR